MVLLGLILGRTDWDGSIVTVEVTFLFLRIVGCCMGRAVLAYAGNRVVMIGEGGVFSGGLVVSRLLGR